MLNYKKVCARRIRKAIWNRHLRLVMSTAYLIRCVDITVLLPCVVLWLGCGVATALMFSKAIWVHPFIHQGNQPRYLITKELIDAYKSNGAYQHTLLVSAIEENQYCYDHNSNILEKRAKVIKCVMKVIKTTFLMVAVITIFIKLAEYLNCPWVTIIFRNFG